MERIVKEIVDYLLTLPEGTEVSTGQVIEKLYGNNYLNSEGYDIYGKRYYFDDFFKIDNRVYALAKKRGLILDGSKYEGTVTGLPFDVPYVLRRKRK